MKERCVTQTGWSGLDRAQGIGCPNKIKNRMQTKQIWNDSPCCLTNTFFGLYSDLPFIQIFSGNSNVLTRNLGQDNFFALEFNGISYSILIGNFRFFFSSCLWFCGRSVYWAIFMCGHMAPWPIVDSGMLPFHLYGNSGLFFFSLKYIHLSKLHIVQPQLICFFSQSCEIHLQSFRLSQ